VTQIGEWGQSGGCSHFWLGGGLTRSGGLLCRRGGMPDLGGVLGAAVGVLLEVGVVLSSLGVVFSQVGVGMNQNESLGGLVGERGGSVVWGGAVVEEFLYWGGADSDESVGAEGHGVQEEIVMGGESVGKDDAGAGERVEFHVVAGAEGGVESCAADCGEGGDGESDACGYVSVAEISRGLGECGGEENSESGLGRAIAGGASLWFAGLRRHCFISLNCLHSSIHFLGCQEKSSCIFLARILRDLRRLGKVFSS